MAQSKLIVICGPTSSGKTSLAIKLCREFGGEIVSADSRQVYWYMDVGTGKMPACTTQISNLKTKKRSDVWEIGGVPIYGYDLVEPDEKFSAAEFRDFAQEKFTEIWQRGKIPFLVGGTGFYIAAALGETQLAGVEPDWDLREELEKLSTEELVAKLEELDPGRAAGVDRRNRRRLIRAVEIATSRSLPHDVAPIRVARRASSLAPPFILKFGLTAPREVLYARADHWAEVMVAGGLIDETRGLVEKGYRAAPPMKGIIYRTVADYLDGKLSREEMVERIKFDLHGYIRRQLTWFRRDKETNWLDISKPDFDTEAESLVRSYLG